MSLYCLSFSDQGNRLARKIADAFSISRRHVNDIVNGRTWKLEG